MGGVAFNGTSESRLVTVETCQCVSMAVC